MKRVHFVLAAAVCALIFAPIIVVLSYNSDCLNPAQYTLSSCVFDLYLTACVFTLTLYLRRKTLISNSHPFAIFLLLICQLVILSVKGLFIFSGTSASNSHSLLTVVFALISLIFLCPLAWVFMENYLWRHSGYKNVASSSPIRKHLITGATVSGLMRTATGSRSTSCDKSLLGIIEEGGGRSNSRSTSLEKGKLDLERHALLDDEDGNESLQTPTSIIHKDMETIMDCKNVNDEKNHASFYRLAHWAEPEWKLLTIATIMLVIASACAMAQPLYFGRMIGNIYLVFYFLLGLAMSSFSVFIALLYFSKQLLHSFIHSFIDSFIHSFIHVEVFFEFYLLGEVSKTEPSREVLKADVYVLIVIFGVGGTVLLIAKRSYATKAF